MMNYDFSKDSNINNRASKMESSRKLEGFKPLLRANGSVPDHIQNGEVMKR